MAIFVKVSTTWPVTAALAAALFFDRILMRGKNQFTSIANANIHNNKMIDKDKLTLPKIIPDATSVAIANENAFVISLKVSDIEVAVWTCFCANLPAKSSSKNFTD